MNNQQNNEDADKFTTGLWKRKSKKTGKPYLGGSFQNYWVHYYPNDNPERTDRDPDGFIMLYSRNNEDEKPIRVNMFVRHTKKDGVKYVSGKRGKRFNIFANDRKPQQSPRAPDYNLIVYKIEERPQTREENPEPMMPQNQMEDPGYMQDPEEEEVF